MGAFAGTQPGRALFLPALKSSVKSTRTNGARGPCAGRAVLAPRGRGAGSSPPVLWGRAVEAGGELVCGEKAPSLRWFDPIWHAAARALAFGTTGVGTEGSQGHGTSTPAAPGWWHLLLRWHRPPPSPTMSHCPLPSPTVPHHVPPSPATPVSLQNQRETSPRSFSPLLPRFAARIKPQRVCKSISIFNENFGVYALFGLGTSVWLPLGSALAPCSH